MAQLVLSYEVNFGSGASGLVTGESTGVPGVGYGATTDQSGQRATAIALRFVADRLDAGDYTVDGDGLSVTVTQSRP